MSRALGTLQIAFAMGPALWLGLDATHTRAATAASAANPGRAMDATAAYLKAPGPQLPSEWATYDEREMGPREALLRLLELLPNQQLERLVDLATESDLTPELRRVAIEMLAPRIGQGPERAARIAAIEQSLAASRPAGEGQRARTDTCLRRRFRLKGWTRARRWDDPCNGRENELTDWVRVISAWSVELPFPRDTQSGSRRP